jgi:hypothetical protein
LCTSVKLDHQFFIPENVPSTVSAALCTHTDEFTLTDGILNNLFFFVWLQPDFTIGLLNH